MFSQVPRPYGRGGECRWYQVPSGEQYVWGWVCLGVCRGGGAGMSRRGGTSPLPRIHGTWDTTGYGRQAGGTHPSGMLSFNLLHMNDGISNFVIVNMYLH